MKEDFIRKYRQSAILVGMACDFPPVILLVQAALETGWGRHVPKNNLFGIKDVPWIPGNQVLRTSEYKNGWKEETVEFEDFQSPLESMLAYVALIRNSRRYRTAWALRHDPESYFRAIQAAGYATDPQYAEKCISIWKNFPEDPGKEKEE